MSVDTDAKLQSATHFIMPFYPPLPTTDSDITKADTQAVAWCYSGILASAVAAVTVTKIFLTFVGKAMGLTFAGTEPGLAVTGTSPGLTIQGDR